ncbi:MAG: DUF86 domain-containing protein [Nitrososphaerota archaeon]|nr:DUF86 domain-containing protein [Nitrososphaerota archaeon]
MRISLITLIKSEVIKTLKQILNGDENVLVGYIFGSFVHDYVTPLSDVDIAVLLNDGSLKKLSELWSKIAKGLKVNEDLIDLVNLSDASTSLKFYVLKNGIKLLDRGSYDDELKSQVIKDYPDAKLLLNSMYEEGLKDLSCELNKDLLKSRVSEVVERLTTLREEILSKEKEEVLKSRLYKASMERCLHISIEAILDICRHIVSVKKLGIPETYRELIELLSEASIIPNDLADKLKELIGLRNILIHRYMIIDHERLYNEIESVESVAKSFIMIVEELIRRGC